MIISILLNGGDYMASKHLSYEERLKIQEGLSQNKAIFVIAKSFLFHFDTARILIHQGVIESFRIFYYIFRVC